MKNSQCSLSIGCLEKRKNILFRSLLYTIQITSYQKTSGLSAVPLLSQQVSIFINQRSFGQRERIVDTDDQNDHRDFFGKKELYLPLDMLLQQHVIPPKWLLKKYHTRLLEQHPPPPVCSDHGCLYQKPRQAPASARAAGCGKCSAGETNCRSAEAGKT